MFLIYKPFLPFEYGVRALERVAVEDWLHGVVEDDAIVLCAHVLVLHVLLLHHLNGIVNVVLVVYGLQVEGRRGRCLLVMDHLPLLFVGVLTAQGLAVDCEPAAVFAEDGDALRVIEGRGLHALCADSKVVGLALLVFC